MSDTPHLVLSTYNLRMMMMNLKIKRKKIRKTKLPPSHLLSKHMEIEKTVIREMHHLSLCNRRVIYMDTV